MQIHLTMNATSSSIFQTFTQKIFKKIIFTFLLVLAFSIFIYKAHASNDEIKEIETAASSMVSSTVDSLISTPVFLEGAEFKLSSYLSSDAIKVLQEVYLSGKSDDDQGFSLRFLIKKGTEKSLPQLIVLAGERSHTKNQESSELGKKLLKEFKHRGLEGYFDHTQSRVEQCMNRAVLSIVGVGVKISQWCDRKGNECPSTIHDAIEEFPVCLLSHLKEIVYARSVFKKSIETFDHHQMSDEQRKTHLVQIEKTEVSEEAEVSVQEVLTVIDGLDKILGANLGHPINIGLEENHQPDLKEKISSVMFPLHVISYMTLCAATVCTYLPYSGDLFSENGASAIRMSVATLLVHRLFSVPFYERFKKLAHSEDSSVGVLLSPFHGLVGARNRTMVKNLTQFFSYVPEVQKILVVVGNLHSKGIAELLKDENGFEEIPADYLMVPVLR